MPSDEIEKFRLIETKKTYRPTISEWLVDDWGSATWNQVRKFVFSFYPPGPDQLALFHDITTWSLEKKLPPNIKLNGGSLQDYLLAGAARYRLELDHLSWVGSIVPPIDSSEKDRWINLSDTYILSWSNDHGAPGGFLTVHGPPQIGKTGTALDVADVWLKNNPGCEVLTNIPLLRPVPRFRSVTRGAMLFHGIADALKAKRKWLWAWDEPNLSGYGKQDAPTNVAKDISRFARIIPKLGGSMIYIEHVEEGVPSIINIFSDSRIICTDRGSIIAHMPLGDKALYGVPKPKTEYRPGEAGYFDLKDGFDWQGAFRALKFDPDQMLLEDTEASLQGERIEIFLQAIEGGKLVRCLDCAHEWIPRGEGLPDRCSNCNSRDPFHLRVKDAS